LRESEEEFRSIVETTTEWIWTIDRRARLTYSNPAIKRILGYQPEEVIGKDALLFMHEQDRIEIEEVLPKLVSEKKGWSELVLRWRHKNGTYRHLKSNAVPILNDGGELLGYRGADRDITERKEVEAKLRSSEAELRALFESMDDVILVLDSEGRYLSIAPTKPSLLYKPPEQLVGKTLHEVFPTEQADMFLDHVRCVLETQRPIKIEYSLQIDGEEFWFAGKVSPMLEDSVVWVARDVTERKRVEKDLRRSEARLAEAQRIANLGNFEWDTKTGRVWWSDETYRIYGYEPGKLAPTLQTVTDVFHPEDRHLLRATIDNAFYEDKPHDFEHRVVRPDGEVRWIHRRVEIVRGEGEESLRLIGTVHDITERKAVERELIQRARHAALGEDVGAALNEGGNLRMVLWRCAEAMVRHLDAAFARIWTLNEEEDILELQASAGMYTHLDGPHSRIPLGRFKIGLIALERRPHLTNDIVGDPRVHDKEWAKREGIVAFAGYPLVVEDRLVGVLAMFAKERLADATLNALASVASTLAQGIERKRAEESLKAYAARLNQSNRELQDFAYVASHDLQEPLRKVRTFGDRLNAKYAEALGEQGRDYLKRMEGAAARMQDLIDDLLELSRVTTNAQPFTPVDLNEVTQEVVSDLEARIEQIGGRVEVSRLPIVEADRLQMRQLLQNLISNALKFHREEEEPVVKVYSELLQEWEEEGSGRIADRRAYQIFVEDNGIGFDEKYLERVLAPFQRLHGRDAYEGTGMGMAICRKVVERHNGYITAKSIPGQGATFIVTLPVRQSEDNLEEKIS
ncbi:MAG TPA: PAS domain S-box protein, partial [Rubrobacteraceae bacterium]|nr:PAS domain S-box protein [Rubrobacteraceae bacterium]